MSPEELLALISKYVLSLLTVGGGSATVAWLIMRSWGKGWLDSHFNKRLEEFKHEQTKEIERIRANINTTFDRKQRLHQLEFDALPRIWSDLCNADTDCRRFLSPLRQYPDAKTLGDSGIREVLSGKGVIESDISRVLISSDIQKEFQWYIEKFNYNECVASFLDFRKTFLKSSVYLEPGLSKIINEYMDLLHSALFEQSENLLQGAQPWLRDAIKAFEKESKTLTEQIKHEVRQILTSDQSF